MMPEFRLAGQEYLLAWVKLVQDLGVRLVHGQEGMARVAVLRDFTSLLGFVVAIVAAEAPGEICMPQVVRVSSPGNIHLGEYVAIENVEHRGRCLFNLRPLRIVKRGIIRLVIRAKSLRQLDLSRQPAGIVPPQKLNRKLMDERQRGTDAPCCHLVVNR